MKDPLTAEAERNVQELESWYKNDMEVKKSIEELKTTTQEEMARLGVGIGESMNVVTEKVHCLRTAVRQEAQDIKDQLGQMHQSIDRLSSSAAGSQSGGGM